MDIETRIHAILDDVTSALLGHGKHSFITYTRDLVDHNEHGIALEDLGENLYEFDIPLSPATRDKIHAAMLSMNMDPSKFPPIRVLKT